MTTHFKWNSYVSGPNLQKVYQKGNIFSHYKWRNWSHLEKMKDLLKGKQIAKLELEPRLLV